MPWKAIDRIGPLVDPEAGQLLSEAVREKIRSFFDRYETKRAALLPALQIVQGAVGSISTQAMVEIAELLEIHPSDVLDTVTFYTYCWTEPKGKTVVTDCRSLSCEVMGVNAVFEEVKKQLGIDEHQTTPDGEYSLITEECLAGCDYAPCMLINEKLHKRVKPEDVARILADADNDRIAFQRSDLFDAPAGGSAARTSGAASNDESARGDASDNAEMSKPD